MDISIYMHQPKQQDSCAGDASCLIHYFSLQWMLCKSYGPPVYVCNRHNGPYLWRLIAGDAWINTQVPQPMEASLSYCE